MNKIQLFTFDISQHKKELDMNGFSAELAGHINRFKLARDRLRSYCMYRLLRQMLKTEVLDVSFDQNGRPLLPEFRHQISLSHSGNIVAVALSPQKMSVDVEQVNERILQLKSEKWLTKYEQFLARLLPPKKQIRYLTKIWTQKECYLKFMGLSLTSMYSEGAIDFAKLPMEFSFSPKFVRDIYGNKYCLTLCTVGAVWIVAKRVKEI